MKKLQTLVLEQDASCGRYESIQIHASMREIYRWRKYTSIDHPNIEYYIEKFMSEHSLVPGPLGDEIHYPSPPIIFEYENENGAYKGGVWSNGGVVASILSDKHILELHVDNDTAVVHGYPDRKFTLSNTYQE